jgi:hypothetical protein
MAICLIHFRLQLHEVGSGHINGEELVMFHIRVATGVSSGTTVLNPLSSLSVGNSVAAVIHSQAVQS